MTDWTYIPPSRASARLALEQLQLDPKIRAHLATKGDAISFRQQIYSERAAIRKNNCKIYHEGEPMWNKSPWDNLQIEISQWENHYVVDLQLLNMTTSSIKFEVIPEDEQ